jgi:hypothetical protein
MRAGLIGAALATALLGGAATARDVPQGGLTQAEIAAWVQAKGYSTEVITDSNGSTHIRAMIDGLKYGFYMFDCKDGRCGSVQFSVGWATHGKFNIGDINRWNRDRRWCRGYFDSTNDPWVEMDVDLTPAATYELLDDEFATYKGCISGFQEFYPVTK